MQTDLATSNASNAGAAAMPLAKARALLAQLRGPGWEAFSTHPPEVQEAYLGVLVDLLGEAAARMRSERT